MTFHRSTKEIKCGDYYRTRPHFDDDDAKAWNSIKRESYKDPRKTDGSHNFITTSKVNLNFI